MESYLRNPGTFRASVSFEMRFEKYAYLWFLVSCYLILPFVLLDGKQVSSQEDLGLSLASDTKLSFWFWASQLMSQCPWTTL